MGRRRRRFSSEKVVDERSQRSSQPHTVWKRVWMRISADWCRLLGFWGAHRIGSVVWVKRSNFRGLVKHRGDDLFYTFAARSQSFCKLGIFQSRSGILFVCRPPGAVSEDRDTFAIAGYLVFLFEVLRSLPMNIVRGRRTPRPVRHTEFCSSLGKPCATVDP